jgi:excisionase family DNA binding protein
MDNLSQTPSKLTVRQAANRLNVCTKTVYRMLESGKLRGFKLSKDWRVLLVSIEALESGNADSTDEGAS